MRNVFDQYEQPENRLTHALMAGLAADPKLLRQFLRWVGGKNLPQGTLRVLEQSLPDEKEDRPVLEDSDERALPDGWIYDHQARALLVESKVTAKPDLGQVARHLRRARRLGFDAPRLLLLTVRPVSWLLPPEVVNKLWTDVYDWLRNSRRRSDWASRAAEYFEIAEAQADMKEHLHDGTLTRFTGIPFGRDNPYGYVQAKRLLGLLRDELRLRRDLARIMRIDRHSEGRGAITRSSGTSVWDFISFRHANGSDTFTRYPHLTIGISNVHVDATVTIPNGLHARSKTALFGGDFESFSQIVDRATRGIEKTLRRFKGGIPQIVVVQRRYPSQRASPFVDASLRFDPRTATGNRGKRGRSAVKRQPQWLRAAFDALTNRKSNLQFQIGAVFPYQHCVATKSTKIVEAIAATWIACLPVIAAVRVPLSVRSKKRARRVRRRSFE